jgi:hypothetical protein
MLHKDYHRKCLIEKNTGRGSTLYLHTNWPFADEHNLLSRNFVILALVQEVPHIAPLHLRV